MTQSKVSRLERGYQDATRDDIFEIATLAPDPDHALEEYVALVREELDLPASKFTTKDLAMRATGLLLYELVEAHEAVRSIDNEYARASFDRHFDEQLRKLIESLRAVVHRAKAIKSPPS